MKKSIVIILVVSIFLFSNLSAAQNYGEGAYGSGSYGVGETSDTTAPTVSFSCTPTSVNTGETITCSCSATDDTDASPTVSYTANPSTSSTGTFTTTCTATDSSSNSASSSVEYTVSSSGGGSGTPTQYSVGHTWGKGVLNAGEEALKIIESKNIDVTEIKFTSKIDSEDDVRLFIIQYRTKPSDAPETVNGKEKAFLKVELTGLEDKNIEDISIKFFVDKTWLSENSFSKEEVKLYRFTDQWDELETAIKSETDDKVEYGAISPGFSYFSITAKKTENSITSNGSSKSNKTIEKKENETKEPGQSEPVKPTGAIPINNILILIAVVFIILIIVSVFIMRKRNSPLRYRY